MTGLRARTVVTVAGLGLALAGAVVGASGAGRAPQRAAFVERSLPREIAWRARALAPHVAAVTASSSCGRPPREHLITHPRWLHHVAITEYYSTPERWFSGRRVPVPGLASRHRVDWLYSAKGVAMQGDGIGLDGQHYHIDALGSGGWVNRAGRHTVPGRCASHWSHGRPFWLQGGWRNHNGGVTWPLPGGGWSHGVGRRLVSYGGVTFAPGSSIPLHPYRTLAVDPRLIPRGSRIYIPAYRAISGGWFVAQDTGGAIIGRHVDVYRPPPSTPLGGGQYLRDERIYVVPPA